MLEMVDVTQIAQVLKIAHHKVVHGFELADFTNQEDGPIGHLPELLGPLKTMIHAATTSFELGRQRSTTVELLIAVLITVTVILDPSAVASFYLLFFSGSM